MNQNLQTTEHPEGNACVLDDPLVVVTRHFTLLCEVRQIVLVRRSPPPSPSRPRTGSVYPALFILRLTVTK